MVINGLDPGKDTIDLVQRQALVGKENEREICSIVTVNATQSKWNQLWSFSITKTIRNGYTMMAQKNNDVDSVCRSRQTTKSQKKLPHWVRHTKLAKNSKSILSLSHTEATLRHAHVGKFGHNLPNPRVKHKTNEKKNKNAQESCDERESVRTRHTKWKRKKRITNEQEAGGHHQH